MEHVSRLILGVFVVFLLLETASAQDTTATDTITSSDVSDEKLRAVAEAYRAVEAIQEEYRAEYGELSGDNLAPEVERGFLQEVAGAVEAEGITWATYTQVLRAVQEDIVLNERFYTFLGREVVVEAKAFKPKKPISANGNLRLIQMEDLQNMPINSASAAIGLLPGVNPGLQIRGGSPGEVAVYMDGMSLRTGRRNAPFIAIPYTLIDQIQVATSGFSAEYGNARAGVINIRTKGNSGPPAVISVSGETLEAVARASAAIASIREAYGITGLEQDNLESSDLQQAEYEMVQVIIEEDLTVDTYLKVVRAAESNAKLREQLRVLIKAVQ